MSITQAAKEGYLEKIRSLVKNANNINEIDEYGRTALHIAASEGYDDVVSFLLSEGVSINAIDNDGWTPLFSACINQHISTAMLLLDHKADPNICSKGVSPLLIAAEHPTKELVQKFIISDANLNFQLPNLSTAMHLVALSDLQHGEKLQIMEGMFDAGAELLWDDCGHTPADCLGKDDLPLVGEFNQYVQSKM